MLLIPKLSKNKRWYLLTKQHLYLLDYIIDIVLHNNL